jgi:hypothetical protein
MRHLAGAGATRAQGTITLDTAEREALTGGRLSMVVYTRRSPFGSARAAMTLPGSP